MAYGAHHDLTHSIVSSDVLQGSYSWKEHALTATNGVGPDAIRLLRITPTENEALTGEIAVHLLQEAPVFSALSYCWGDQPATATLKVPPHQQTVSITPRLHRILVRLRNACRGRWLWIDAVCIDQTNEAEKSHQVTLMQQVYTQASSVYVWLGEERHESSLTCCSPYSQCLRGPYCARTVFDRSSRALQLRDVASRASCEPHTNGWGHDDVFWIGTSGRDAALGDETVPHPEVELFGPQGSQEWRDMHKTSKSHGNYFACVLDDIAGQNITWWSRLWVIQELAAARDVYVFAGPYVLTWHAFVSTFTTHWGTLHSVYNISFDGYQQGLSDAQNMVSELQNLRVGFRNAGHREPLETLLRKTQTAQYSDVRDRVYALLGLARECDRQDVPVNYGSPIALVFAYVALSMVKRRSLNILHDWPRIVSESTTSAAGMLPSWVPDFTQPQRNERNVRIGRINSFYAGTSTGSSWSWPTFDADTCLLWLKAVPLDIVAEVAYNLADETDSAQSVEQDIRFLWDSTLPNLRPVIEAGLNRAPPPSDPRSQIDCTGFLKTLFFDRGDDIQTLLQRYEISRHEQGLRVDDIEGFGDLIQLMLEARDSGQSLDDVKRHLGSNGLAVASYF